MNFATIEAASLISIANAHVESTFKSIKKSAPLRHAVSPNFYKFNYTIRSGRSGASNEIF
ncbi:hypothetical protein ABB40_11330 [Lacticaseibacillus paracasei]|nr:hypothetical protein ABB40_11330 [Lacticaseibacillus paracasei]